MTAIRIVAAALLVGAGCAASGDLLLRALRTRIAFSERWFLAFLVGAAVMSSVMFLLCAVHIGYTPILAGILAFPIAADLFLLAKERPAFRTSAPERPSPLPPFWGMLCWVLYTVFAVLYFVNAMLPETSPDAMVYHLALVSRYSDHHGFYHVSNLYGGFPGGVEMLFLPAYSMGGFSSAALVHLLFLLVLPLAILRFAKRWGRPEAGVIGALLFFLSPVVGKDGASAYNDVAVAAVVFGCVYVLDLWVRSPDVLTPGVLTLGQKQGDSKGLLIVAGLLAGYAFACKYTAGPVAVFAVLFVMATTIRRHPRSWHSVLLPGAVLGLIAAVIPLPWMIRNFIEYRDPVFPLFTGLFPTPFLYPMVEDFYHYGLAHMNNVGLTRIPAEVLYGGSLTGVLGPVFVLAPLALVSLRHPFGRLLIAACLFVVSTYFGNIGTRFLIPALPFLSLALGDAIVSLPRVGKPVAVVLLLLHAILSWPPIIPKWSHDTWRLARIDWKPALRISPEADYLRREYPPYEVGLLLDRFVPRGQKVLSPDLDHSAYHHAELVGTWESNEAKRAHEVFLAPSIPYGDRLWRREVRFAPRNTDAIRLTVIKSPGSDLSTDLRISEIRFFNGPEEIPSAAQWRLTASTNPWEAHLAFDGDLFSWWTSARHVNAGHWLEVRLRPCAKLDRIVLEQAVDSRWFDLVPAFLNGDVWSPVPARFAGEEFFPAVDVHAGAAAALKRMGIHWILIAKGSSGEPDFTSHASFWGATAVGSARDYTLWRLR